MTGDAAEPNPQPVATLDAVVLRPDNETTRALLAAVFPNARKFAGPDYLSWAYLQCPGPYVGLDIVTGTSSICHYGASIRHLTDGTRSARVILSVNSATSGAHRGRSHFVTLARDVYRRAAVDAPLDGVIGVPNRDAIPPRVRRLDWRILGHLNLRVIPVLPRARRGVRSRSVDPQLLMSATLDGFADGIGFADNVGADDTARAWRPQWTRDWLAWRLGNPLEHYALHQSEAVTAVSCGRRVGGLSIAVVTKLFPAPGRLIARDAVRPVLQAVAAHHGTPIIVHAGVDTGSILDGANVPVSWRRSPLALGVRPTAGGLLDAPDVRIEGFEFFDFDVF